MSREIYVDNAATTPVHPDVAREIMDCLISDYGNPSSLHRLGMRAEKRLEASRSKVADVLEVEAKEIIFTSGGTESNNISIMGTVHEKKRRGRHCITTVIEHPSTLNTFRYLEGEGWDITYLPVNSQGVIDLDKLKGSLRPDTVLVSIIHVNNEIGSIQPIDEIGYILKNREHPPVFHVDAVQSFGKLDLRPADWGIDLLSVSGHKIHAAKGVGALYIKKGTRLKSLNWGGGQEGGLRSGTENLPGIAGFGKAAEWVGRQLANNKNKLKYLKTLLIQGIEKYVPEAVLNGPEPEMGAPHIINLSIPGIPGEVLLHALEGNGVYVGTGSACSSRKKNVSHVLEAVGTRHDLAKCAIRISLSYLNTEEEMEEIPIVLAKSINQVIGFRRRG